MIIRQEKQEDVARINPFEPNSPVNPGVFVGRISELRRLKAALVQTAAGRPVNFMITGERGIGKTSLLNYLKFVAEGYIPVEETKLSFLVVDTDIDENTSQSGLVQKIELGIRKALGNSESARSWLDKAWGFAKRLEVSGIKLRPEERIESEELLSEEFSYSLAELSNRVCVPAGKESAFGARYDGILILIDEADNCSSKLRLGSFLKLLSERLQRRGCNRVVVGLAGLTELRARLMDSHPSSPRLFDEMVLGRLSEPEVDMVVELCLDETEKLNGTRTKITLEGMQYLRLLSEGYPHFIQQFGYSAFDADKNDEIDTDDVMKGAFGTRGAMEAIGDRYYRGDFYKKIQKESYRQVLRIMAENLDDWVTKKEIRSKFKGKTSILDNAIHALRDRKIILPKEGEPGVYRLQHKGFALWIKRYTTDPEELRQKAAVQPQTATPSPGEEPPSSA